MRTCIGCRSVAPCSDLVRVAQDAGGRLHLSPRLSGRGAWLCQGDRPGMPSGNCLEQAVRRQAFSRAFRVAVTAEAVEALRRTVEERARIDKGGAAGVAARRD